MTRRSAPLAALLLCSSFHQVLAQPTPPVSPGSPPSSPIEHRLQQLEATVQSLGTTLSDDEKKLDKEKEDISGFASHEDRYLSLSNIVVAGVGAFVAIGAIVITIFSYAIAIRTADAARSESSAVLKESQAGIAEMKLSTIETIRGYQAEFEKVLQTARRASGESKTHLEASQQHIEQVRQDATAIAAARDEVERTLARLRDFATNTLFEQQYGRANDPTAVPAGTGQEAADILNRFGGATPFDSNFARALVEQNRRNYDVAFDAFRAAVNAAPDDLARAKALYSLAVTHLLKNRTEASQAEALTTLDEVIKLQPALLRVSAHSQLLARTQMLRAGIQRDRGELDAAIAANTWVIDRYADTEDPSLRALYARARLDRGMLRMTRGDADGALEDFDTLLKSFATTTDIELRWQVTLAHYNKGRALLAGKQFSLAANAFRASLERLTGATDPRSRTIEKHACLAAADALDQLGDSDGATEMRSRAASLDPSSHTKRIKD